MDIYEQSGSLEPSQCPNKFTSLMGELVRGKGESRNTNPRKDFLLGSHFKGMELTKYVGKTLECSRHLGDDGFRGKEWTKLIKVTQINSRNFTI